MKLVIPKSKAVKLYKYLKIDVSNWTDFEIVTGLKQICKANKKKIKNPKVREFVKGIFKAKDISIIDKENNILASTDDSKNMGNSDSDNNREKTGNGVVEEPPKKEYRTRKSYTKILRDFVNDIKDTEMWYTKNEILQETGIPENLASSYLSRFARQGILEKVTVYRKRNKDENKKN